MITSLQQIVDQKLTVSTDEFNLPENIEVSKAIQVKLCDLGILDPTFGGDAQTPFGPVDKGDGRFGLNSRNALFEFCKLVKLKYVDRRVNPDLAKALIAAQPDTMMPIITTPDKKDDTGTQLAKKVLAYMLDKGYWIARSPNMYNIVYSEGMNGDGTLNEDVFNEWNDRRMVIRIAPGGKPQMLVNDQGTTEPGKFYTDRPMNPQGAARLAFGQYKAWCVGLHQGTQPALVQRDLLRVHRDLNKDGKRTNDMIDIGTTFGVNQHTTSRNKIPAFVGPFSAGCLVGRRYDYHLLFLKTIKQDVRYKLNNGYMFVSTLIAGDDLVKKQGVPVPRKAKSVDAPGGPFYKSFDC